VYSWGSLSFLFGPLVAFLGLGLMVIFLRWAHSKKKVSLIERPSHPSDPSDYGMLVPIAFPDNYAKGEILRRQLQDVGIKATLTFTVDGPRILVWPEDENIARQILAKR
jgi:hypothetical protein